MLPLWTFPLRTVAVACVILTAPGEVCSAMPAGQAPTQAPASDASQTPPQLDSLVAPIALYPDPLLAQVLAASTYPLEVAEASSWVQQNNTLHGEALVNAAAKQDWEPSIQALVVFPDVLRRMDENLRWTTSLGNAFLAQEGDLMSAVQRMRQKAYAAGTIKSTSQQKVEVQTVEGAKVIVIEPADPKVVYVPAYNPTVVYGAPPVYAPYPVMVYPPPPSTGSLVAASLISFGAGIALGAAFRGCCGYGGWGWGCTWGPRPALYVNNVFVNRYGFRASPYVSAQGRSTWAHNSYYRRAVPYSSPAVAGRYGANRPVATPYSSGNRGAATVRTPNGAGAAVSGPRGSAAAVRTPKGSAVVTKPTGQPPRTTSMDRGATAAPRANANPRPNAFSGATSSADRARMESARGERSLQSHPPAVRGSGAPATKQRRR